MALTAAQVQAYYIGFYGRPADTVGLNYWITQDAAAADAGFAASAEYTNLYAGMTTEQRVSQIYVNVLGRAADVTGLVYWSGELVAGRATTATIITQMMTNALGKDVTTIADRKTFAQTFTDHLDTTAEIVSYTGTAATAAARTVMATIVATAVDDHASLTAATAAVDTSIATVTSAGTSSSGQTFTLTTGVDSHTGTSGADFFDGSPNTNGNQTLSINDVLNGGADTDTLSATVGAGTITTGNIDAIEVFEITATGAATFNMAATTGYTKLTNLSSTNTLAFNNIEAATVAGAVRNATALTTFNLTNAGLSGATDNFAITTEGALTTGITVSDTTGSNALETLTIATENASVTIPTLTVTDLGLTKLVVSGDKDLTITTLTDGTAGGATLNTIDASALTGSLTVTAVAAGTVTGGAGSDALTGTTGNDVIDGGAGNDAITMDTGNDSITAGTGNDTITAAGNLTIDDTIAGGDGTDKLSISAAATVGQAVNVSGIETIVLSGGNVTQDMDAFSTTEVTRVNTSTVHTFVINDAGDQIATLGIDAAVTATTLARKTDGTANALTINMGTSTAGVTAVAVTADNEESITINSAGGSNKITTLNAADVTSLTITGNKSLDVDDNAIGGATLLATINASAFTGTALTLNATNSTKALTYTHGSGTITLTTGSGNDVATGGTGADSLNGGTGNDSLTGGTGNDTLDGGAGNDTLTSGDGEDSIVAGAGNDSIDAGAGNDTINFSTNLATTDTVNGGADTDTILFTVSTTIAPTLTAVEKATVTFGATSGGAFNAGNATALTTYTLDSSNDVTTATVTNIATGATVIISDANTDVVTLDTAAAAALTLSYRAASGGATTITDAATVTISGATANASSASLALDDVDTTTLVVNGPASAFTLGTGNITGTDKLASLTVATTTTGGTATIGTVVDADSLTSLTVTAVNADATTGAIGGTGTAEVLAAISVSASGGATATVGAITADTTDSTTDNAMVLTVSSDVGATVTMGAINNQYGTINATLTGAGTITIGAFTAADLGTFDASGTSGAVTLAMTTVALGGTVTFGSGAAIYQASQGNDTVTFGAANATTDTITLSNTAGGMVTITNFKTGSTAGDLLKLDSSAIGVPNDGNSAATATGSLTVKEAAAATTLAAGDEVIVLTGAQFATSALAEVAIEASGSRALTFATTLSAGDDVLVAWSDGSNSYIGAYNDGTGGTTLAAGGTMTVLVTLVGVDVSTAGTLLTANLELVA